MSLRHVGELRRQPAVILLVTVLLAACAAQRSPSVPQASGEMESTPPSPSTSASSTPASSVASDAAAGPSECASWTAASDDTPPVEPTAEMSIADLLRADVQFARFCRLTERSTSPGLGLSWLEIWDLPAERMGDNQDGVTVFVPTNAAFDTLDPGVHAALERGGVANDLQYALLGHHYVHRLYPSSAFEPGPQRTWSGTGTVELTLDPITFGGCAVVQADLRVANGYVHVIDCVVLPPDLTDAGTG